MNNVCQITESDGRIINHSRGADGNDYTLCGLALEGFDTEFSSATFEKGVITCAKCATIINFCKKIRKSQISADLIRIDA